MSEMNKEATRYAERLAVALHQKHYPEVVQWKPLSGDLLGLLTQIDNMTAGLARSSDLIRTASDFIAELKSMGYGETSERALPGSFDPFIEALRKVKG